MQLLEQAVTMTVTAVTQSLEADCLPKCCNANGILAVVWNTRYKRCMQRRNLITNQSYPEDRQISCSGVLHNTIHDECRRVNERHTMVKILTMLNAYDGQSITFPD